LSGRAEFVVGSWCEAVSGGFDLIVSNPPYIAAKEMACLQPEVLRFDPHLALSGGTDGLDAYRAFIPMLTRYLRPDGVVLMEVGYEQFADVAALCAAHGLGDTVFHRDLSGINRVVQAKTAR